MGVSLCRGKSPLDFRGQKGIHKADFVGRRLQPFAEVYTTKRELGRGSFGVVSLAINNNTGQTVVCKEIQKGDGEDVMMVRAEIGLLKSLDHPHIVRIFEHFEERSRFLLIMECLPGGDVGEELDSLRSDEWLDEATVARYARQLLMATCYCHQKKVIHRDIKPENMMKVSKRGLSDIKVIDYGLASLNERDHMLSCICGTPLYMAPEVFHECYDYKADIWSIGMTLYYMMVTDFPFPTRKRTLDQIEQSIIRLRLSFPAMQGWSGRSRPSRDLIRDMLQLDPDRRLSAIEALRSEWLVLHADSEAGSSHFAHGLTGLQEAPLVIRAVMLMAASRMDIKELQQCQQEFHQVDRDNDGFITVEELKLLQSHNRSFRRNSRMDVAAMLALVDLNGDGVVEFTEFVAASLFAKHNTDDFCRYAFDLFDINGDGFITQEELRARLDTPQMRMLAEEAKEPTLVSSLAKIFPANTPMGPEEFARQLKAHCRECKAIVAPNPKLDSIAPSQRTKAKVYDDSDVVPASGICGRCKAAKASSKKSVHTRRQYAKRPARPCFAWLWSPCCSS